MGVGVGGRGLGGTGEGGGRECYVGDGGEGVWFVWMLVWDYAPWLNNID